MPRTGPSTEPPKEIARFAKLPKGTPVQIDLPREMWPEKYRKDGKTVRMQVRGKLAAKPYCNGRGKWVCRLLGRGPTYPLEAMRPQRGHTPRPPLKKAPTIPLTALEEKARGILGDQFVRVEARYRVNKSERVTLCYGPVPEEFRGTLTGKFKGRDYAHEISITKDRTGGDPDASRKAFLKFLDDLTVQARIAAGKLTGSVVEG